MKLYDYELAPSPRRVRIFLAEKGMDIPTVQVDLLKGEQFSDEFRRVNPRCVVPYLVLDDGTGIGEAAVISRYLEEVQPDPPLFGTHPAERAVAAMWNRSMESDGFSAIAEVLRNESPAFKHHAVTGPLEVEQIPELAERGRKRTAWFLDQLNERLSESDYVAGPRFSIADITALVMVDFAGWIKMGIGEGHTGLRRWHEEVSARASAKA